MNGLIISKKIHFALKYAQNKADSPMCDCFDEERTNKRPQYRHRSADNGIKCTLSTSSSSSSLGSIASISVSSQSTGEMSDDESLSIDSDDEIPIWVHGEQRWISGITNETTCGQLVEALLQNEGINGEPISGTTTTAEHQYAITERWRRVEQMLDNKTKILKIWKAWGQTKSEVRLTLRRLDSHNIRSRSHHVDYDSGRESPISRADSAIVRRRRHRTAKTSKNAKTVHPKSSKASIEKLMKLILEQGETIQHQLSKLRDREHEIAEYEDDHHRTHRRHAENKMGKNYLLETYLNGLYKVGGTEADGGAVGNEECGEKNNNNGANGIIDDEIDKAITTPGNSDSGVNTEDIATSPALSSPLTNGSSSSSTDNNNDGKSTGIAKTKIMDTKSLKDICKRLTTKKGKKEKKQSAMKLAEGATSREAKLIAEHESRKEFCAKMEKSHEDKVNSTGVDAAATNDTIVAATDSDNARKPLNVNEHLAGQIELLEKVIAINKHIQREEELLVRLNAKIRKYEVDDPSLSEVEMRKVLDQINSNIENSNTELVKTEHELNESQRMLMTKSQIVKELSKELETLEIDGCTNQNVIQVPSHQIQIHSSNVDEFQEMQQNTSQQQPTPVPSAHPSPETNQMPTVAIPSNSMRTGTLPKLISSVLKKNTPINAKNTYSGTIPKTQQRTTTVCNQIQSAAPPPPPPNVERTMVPVPMPSNAVFVAKNQSFLVPDHVILSQAPLFFQKDTFNGDFMQSTDQRNINNNNNTTTTNNNNNINANNNIYSNRTISNLTSSNSINLNHNVNINPSAMANCAKVGPKKLINGFYKDADSSDTGLSSLGEDGLLHIGTLV
ncbi:putative uncharacterized protein DDB_G0292292 isoform X2 [Sitodiplosis mosellana]|uniref:putative uncharacterized protein DDB_G0292292 isoform X2 n=1 Tax=Sitodiplosis mosellana TaxID=263140 RepID=UPI002444AA27|nr:putative uncharacterized protein DDB_G0292292 isoform X2 [Sitodiplosis mosellana]